MHTFAETHRASVDKPRLATNCIVLETGKQLQPGRCTIVRAVGVRRQLNACHGRVVDISVCDNMQVPDVIGIKRATQHTKALKDAADVLPGLGHVVQMHDAMHHELAKHGLLRLVAVLPGIKALQLKRVAVPGLWRHKIGGAQQRLAMCAKRRGFEGACLCRDGGSLWASRSTGTLANAVLGHVVLVGLEPAQRKPCGGCCVWRRAGGSWRPLQLEQVCSILDVGLHGLLKWVDGHCVNHALL